MIQNITYKDVQLHRGKDFKYYLNITLLMENEEGIYQCDIPEVELPFSTDITFGYTNSTPMCGKERFVDLGFGPLKMQHELIWSLVEKKVKRMTLSEIEKKLGYKIELINEKE